MDCRQSTRLDCFKHALPRKLMPKGQQVVIELQETGVETLVVGINVGVRHVEKELRLDAGADHCRRFEQCPPCGAQAYDTSQYRVADGGGNAYAFRLKHLVDEEGIPPGVTIEFCWI